MVAPIWEIISTLPLCASGMGLRSMMRIRTAIYWASWADCISMIKVRHPDIADEMIV